MIYCSFLQEPLYFIPSSVSFVRHFTEWPSINLSYFVTFFWNPYLIWLIKTFHFCVQIQFECYSNKFTLVNAFAIFSHIYYKKMLKSSWHRFWCLVRFWQVDRTIFQHFLSKYSWLLNISNTAIHWFLFLLFLWHSNMTSGILLPVFDDKQIYNCLLLANVDIFTCYVVLMRKFIHFYSLYLMIKELGIYFIFCFFPLKSWWKIQSKVFLLV